MILERSVILKFNNACSTYVFVCGGGSLVGTVLLHVFKDDIVSFFRFISAFFVAAAAVSAVQMANGHPPAKRFISSLDITSGDFVNTPRRERFVFRPNHVAILEKYFNEDSYPSYEKREEIARTLNASTEAASQYTPPNHSPHLTLSQPSPRPLTTSF